MNAATKVVSIVDRVQLVRIRIFCGHANGHMASVMIGALLIATVLHSGGVSLRTLAVWGLAIGLVTHLDHRTGPLVEAAARSRDD